MERVGKSEQGAISVCLFIYIFKGRNEEFMGVLRSIHTVSLG